MTIEEANQLNFILSFLKQIDITRYIIMEDLSVVINEDLHLNKINLSQIPISIREVNGTINISYCNFSNLIGLPKTARKLRITHCKFMNSLEGCPTKIEESMKISLNIDSLKHLPEYVGGDLTIISPNIKNLHYITKHVGGDIKIDDCVELNSLDTNDESSNVIGNIYIGDTPIAKKLVQNKVQSLGKVYNSFLFSLPGKVLKYHKHIMTTDKSYFDELNDLIIEINDGME